MSDKLVKNSSDAKYDLATYDFDDGVDPRDLLPGKKGSKQARSKKLFHETWAEKIAKEQSSEVYYEEDVEEKQKAEKQKQKTPIDHDRNSRGKSPMIPVPTNSVATDELGAPKFKKKKLSFRKLVKTPRKGGNSKKV